MTFLYFAHNTKCDQILENLPSSYTHETNKIITNISPRDFG